MGVKAKGEMEVWEEEEEEKDEDEKAAQAVAAAGCTVLRGVGGGRGERGGEERERDSVSEWVSE